MRFILCTWFGEFCSCCSLTALPGPAWALLNWICKALISSLYNRLPYNRFLVYCLLMPGEILLCTQVVLSYLFSSGQLLFVVGGIENGYNPTAIAELLSLDHANDPMPTCSRVRRSFPFPLIDGVGCAISKALTLQWSKLFLIDFFNL